MSNETWEAEAKRPNTSPIAAVKIGSIRQFADVYLEDDPDNPGPWLERLTTARGPSREVNLQTHEMVSPEAELELVDGDGEISDLLVETQIQGQETELFSKLRTRRNKVVSKKVFQGPLERREGIAGDTLSCVIRPNRLEKIGIIQTPVSLDRFPSAPANEVGNGCPIVIGLMDTTKTYAKKICPVRAPIVVDAGQGVSLCLHTGYGGTYAATKVLRDRNGVITDLGISGGGNWTVDPDQTDSQDRRFVEAEVVAGAFADGDQFYADAVRGIQKEGYVTLDGVNDYYKLAQADRSGIDFAGAFTAHCKIRTGAAPGSEAICSIWGGAGARQYLLYIGPTGQLRIQLSGDGTNVYLADCTTINPLAANTVYAIWVDYDPTLSGPRIWINGIEQNYAVTGSYPTSLYDSGGEDFCVGAYDNGGAYSARFSGRIYCLILADGAQTLDSGTGDRDTPLEDIVSEWRFYSGIGDDYQGDNDLIPVSLGTTDYTHVSIETTPAWIIDRILRWKPYLNVPCNLVNRASFGALAAEQEADSWHTAEYYAGVIPWTDNSPYIKDTGLIISELLKNQDAVLFENDHGRFTIKSADISETVDEADIVANITPDDITVEDVTHTRRPFELLNDCRYSLKINNRGAGELWTGAVDMASQTAYSLATKDAKIDLPLIRHQTMATAVVNRQMLRRAGDAYKVKFTLADLWGAALNPGDIITLTHPAMPGGWNRKQFYITGVNPDLIFGTVDLIAVSLGDIYGPIIFGGEGALIRASVDTHIKKDYPNTAYGGSVGMQQRYMITEAYTSRLAMRFPIPPGILSIEGANLIVYSMTDYGGTPRIRQLLNVTWGNNSTWNNFAADGAGAAWGEANIGGANLTNSLSGTGAKSLIFNAAGIDYLETVIGGNAEFTLEAPIALGNGNNIASAENANESWIPVLSLSYTV